MKKEPPDCCYNVECATEEDDFPVTVVNMGLKELKFLSRRKVAPDEVVTLSLSSEESGPAGVRVVGVRQLEIDGRSQFEVGAIYVGPFEQLDVSWVKVALQRLGFVEPLVFDRRRYVRRNVDLPAHVYLHQEESSFSCRVLDFGLGGALLETKRPLPRVQQGSPLFLEIKAPSKEKLAARIACIRNPHELEGGESRRYGICFDTDPVNLSLARVAERHIQSGK